MSDVFHMTHEVEINLKVTIPISDNKDTVLEKLVDLFNREGWIGEGGVSELPKTKEGT